MGKGGKHKWQGSGAGVIAGQVHRCREKGESRQVDGEEHIRLACGGQASGGFLCLWLNMAAPCVIKPGVVISLEMSGGKGVGGGIFKA